MIIWYEPREGAIALQSLCGNDVRPIRKLAARSSNVNVRPEDNSAPEVKLVYRSR